MHTTFTTKIESTSFLALIVRDKLNLAGNTEATHIVAHITIWRFYDKLHFSASFEYWFDENTFETPFRPWCNLALCVKLHCVDISGIPNGVHKRVLTFSRTAVGNRILYI